MAASGSVDSGGYQGRVLRFEWGTNSTNAENNTRVIWYKVTAVGGSSSIYYHHNDYVDVNGTRVYSGSSSHSVSTGTVLASGTMTINQSSTSSLTVEMHGGIYSYSDNINTTYSWLLDEIPRYSDITSLSIKSRTINSITISYVVSRSASIYCSIDGGTTWLNNGNPFKTNTTSGEITIYYKDAASSSKLEPNTSYTITVLSRATISGLDRTKNVSATTYDIAKLVNVPNINIGASQALTWTNPSGAATSLNLCKTDNSQITDYGTVTGTSKTVTPDASTIYALTPASNTYTARYIITTTANGTSYTNSKDFTFTVTNSNPTVGTIEYKDTNTETITITGDNQRIIRNKSTLQFILGAATAKNSATISKYTVEINGIKKERTSEGTLDFGTINVTYNTKAQLTVTDSRGNTAIKEITVIVDDWELPNAIISLTRLNNYEDETYLKVDGSYSSVNNKNEMTIQYQYKKNDTNNQTDYSDWVTIGDNIKETLSLDKEFSWTFKIKISDKFGSTVYENIFLAIGMPIAFYDTNLLSLGINCFPSHPKSFEVEGTMYLNGQEVLQYDIVDEW